MAPTYAAAAAGGDTFLNDGRTMLHIKNTGAQITATVTQLVKCSDGFLHSVAKVVPATTGDVMFGTFIPQEFNDVNGSCAITYTAVTGVTVAVIQMSETGRS